MAEKPSVKQILEIYYALRASGVQRFPRPLQPRARAQNAPGPCLFLYDFASAGAHDNMPPILKRLLERLPWGSSVQVSSALEQQPKTPMLDPLNESDVARVRVLIAENSFKRCVCFGWRAAHVLSVALGQPWTLPPEAFEAVVCPADGLGDIEILILPDVRELEAFPDWRARVWESLVTFAPK